MIYLRLQDDVKICIIGTLFLFIYLFLLRIMYVEYPIYHMVTYLELFLSISINIKCFTISIELIIT